MIFQNCLKFHEPYNNLEISLMVFMPNITTNHAITYTNFGGVNNRVIVSHENTFNLVMAEKTSESSNHITRAKKIRLSTV